MSQFVEQVALPQSVIEQIDSMTAQYITDKGFVTCELSVAECHAVATLKYIHGKNNELPDDALWMLGYCDVCCGNHPDKPFHLKIATV